MGKKLTSLQVVGIILVIIGGIVILLAIPLIWEMTIVKIPGVLETEMPQTNVNMLVVGSILVILGGILWKTGRK